MEARRTAALILLVAAASAICCLGKDAAKDVKPIPPFAAPSRRFPSGTTWSVQRAPPKKSLELLPKPQAKTANPTALNIIETIHWLSFPVGFKLAYFIYENSGKIAQSIGGSSRVFLLILALMCQIFGGGFAVMMHEYEGWQVCPFRNPVALTSSDKGDLDQILVPQYNNAWLRAVAYQFLFTFQTLSLALITMASFGYTWKTILLVGATAFCGIVGPRRPFLFIPRVVDGETRPVFPLPWAIFIMLIINGLAIIPAYMNIFGDAVSSWQDSTSLPLLDKLPTWLLVLVPPALLGGGGAIEGYFAESTFNQWHHFGAFVVLMTGLALHFWEYGTLVA